MYEKTLQIIKIAEDVVVGITVNKSTTCDRVLRHIIYPIGLIYSGFQISIANLSKFALLFSSSMIVVGALLKGSLLSIQYQQNLSFLIWFLFVVSIILTLGVMPSMLVTIGIKPDAVKSTIKRIKDLDVMNKFQVETIKSNLKIVEDRIKARFLKFNALLALFWGGWIYMVKMMIENSNKIQPSTPLDASPIVIYLFFLLIAYVVIDSYSKGCNLVFKTVEFALNEIGGELER